MALHNAKASRFIAATLTIIIEALFAFLGGWVIQSMFSSWGLIPSIIAGAGTGVTLFLLYLYCFIFREYAIEAVKVFSYKRGESARRRLGWAAFIAVACILMDSCFNADRILTLPNIELASRLFLWAGLQMFILIPFGLGKLVHAHVNTVDPVAARQQQFVTGVDMAIMSKIEEVIPTLNAHDLIKIKSGDYAPLQARLSAIEAEKSQRVEEPTNPLADMLAGMASRQLEKNTDPMIPAK